MEGYYYLNFLSVLLKNSINLPTFRRPSSGSVIQTQLKMTRGEVAYKGFER